MVYTVSLQTEGSPALFHALKTEEANWERSRISIQRKPSGVEVTFEAKDATALKASILSIIQLLAVYEKMQGVQHGG
ncbi:hypothetical protein HYS48_03980 [Candidatus Woesearchaeota archaeon]|nr:hypothetical protein [Candidatus Woesearchaeota archaeon]